MPAERSPAGGAVGWPATAQYAVALVERRRARSRRLIGWFALVVLAPTLLTALYTLFVATPRYTSDFELTYQTYRGPSSLASGLVQSVTGTAQSNTVDIGTIIYEYLRSSTLADKLDRDLGLRAHFDAQHVDWLSRLEADASRETFLDYFRSRVQVSQGLGGYIKVEVDAFDPAFAQTFAKAIVKAADDMVDDLTSRARGNEVKFAEAELGREEQRVLKARTALTDFQNRQGDQDPTRAASQLGTIVGSIESQLSDARGQLTATGGQLAPNSPIVVQLRARIAALESQLKSEQARLAGDRPAAGGAAARWRRGGGRVGGRRGARPLFEGAERLPGPAARAGLRQERLYGGAAGARGRAGGRRHQAELPRRLHPARPAPARELHLPGGGHRHGVPVRAAPLRLREPRARGGARSARGVSAIPSAFSSSPPSGRARASRAPG